MAAIETLKRFQIIVATVIFLLLSLYMISNDIKGVGSNGLADKLLVPIITASQKPISGVAQAVKGIWGDYIYLVDLKNGNDQLRKKVALLTEKNVSLREMSRENDRLKRYLRVVDGSADPLIVATVIGLDFTGWQKVISINKGEDDGVEKNMAVVAPDGAIGRVLKVYSNASQVLLVTDYSSSIDAVIQRSRVRGIVSGRGSDGLVLRFVANDGDVVKGDMVVTSGLSGIFPKGQIVGKVEKVKGGGRDFFKDVKLSSFVDFLRLEEVLIIKKDSSSGFLDAKKSGLSQFTKSADSRMAK
jgi:rod shape-determining protein MreC